MTTDIAKLLENDVRLHPALLGRSVLPFRYERPKHIRIFENIILQLTDRENQRYIIEIPPRHGKSIAFSILLPAFFLMNHPDRKVILASYSWELASDFAFQVRNILMGNGILSLAKKSESKVITREGGGLFAAGVGGSITGKGAHLLILDDPVKNLEEAESPTIREKVWKWFGAVFLTRAEPGANIVVIQTRWHKDDLSGRLLREQPGEWNEVKMKAISDGKDDILKRKKGEPLWGERFPKDVLLKRKRDIGTYLFSALYQQEPISSELSIFRREWFQFTEKPPRRFDRLVRYWDLASTKNAGDWTAGALVGEKDGITYVLDVRRKQGTPYDIERFVKHTAMEDGRNTEIYFEQEPGAGSRSLIDAYRRSVLFGYYVRADRKNVSKEYRARLASPSVEAGNVFLVRASWNRMFLDEIEAFPEGKHDDMVDAFTGAFFYAAKPVKEISEKPKGV